MEEASQPLPKSVAGVVARYNSSPPNSPNPSPSAIEASIWWRGERAAQEIIRRIRPTVASEQRRKLVVEYLQNLVRDFIGSEIFPFGSFPLKSYLPDGDIDMTAIGIPSSDDAMASEMLTLLEMEEQNKDSNFEVKDVQYIGAEVILVKCVVQNIMVDISFNQIGGLCTLCFFEQVDRFIGKDHLFKRSIMFIKAWCYYESHILGSYHGLISTYALEMLVLYIFNCFHSSLDGPLAVLYRFLDYYSKFDWGKYCISLQGPVLLSSLPELSVETVDNDGGDLLLTEEFIRNCVDFFSVPLKGSEGKSRTFTKKHLNIIDPLRENNNLGRSVSKGNFYRICSAFTYGARKLGQLLLQPAWSIGHEVNVFFMNTLELHGAGERPDVQDWVPRSTHVALTGLSGAKFLQPVEKLEKEKADELSSESLTSKAYGVLNKEMKTIRISGSDEQEGIVALRKTLSQKQQSNPSGEVDRISSVRLTGDAKNLTTSRTSVSKSMTESSKTSSSTKEESILDFRNVYHQPRKDLEFDQISLTSSGPSNVASISALRTHEEMITSMQPHSYETGWVGNFGAGYPSEPLYSVDYGLEGNLGNRIKEPSSLLDEISDLSGDYDMQLNNLNYAVWCHELIMKNYSLPVYQLPPYSYYVHVQDLWTQGSMFTGPISPRPLLFSSSASYSVNLPFTSSSYNTEGSPKPRGLGTYFPKKNYQVKMERHSPRRVKNAVPENQPPRSQDNFQTDTPQDLSSVEKESHDSAVQAELVFSGNGSEKPLEQSDTPQSSSPYAFKPPPNAVPPLEYGKLLFRSLGPVSVEPPSKEHGQKSDFPISHSQGSEFTSPASSSLRPAWGRKSQSYQMKDEDFPPLSG